MQYPLVPSFLWLIMDPASGQPIMMPISDRIYFADDGAIDYFLYNAEEARFSEEREKKVQRSHD